MAKKKEYFKRTWLDPDLFLDFFPWLKDDSSSDVVARCKFCNQVINQRNMSVAIPNRKIPE